MKVFIIGLTLFTVLAALGVLVQWVRGTSGVNGSDMKMGQSVRLAERSFQDPATIDLANALWAGKPSRVRELLNQGGDVKAVGKQGMTLTHFALLAEKNAPEIMKTILEAGADPISRLADGNSVPRKAVQRDHADPRVVEILLDHGVSPNWFPTLGPYSEASLLEAAIGGNNREVVKLLIARGANLNYVNPFQGSALHSALNGLRLAIAADLVEAGIDLTLRSHTSPLIENPRIVPRTALEEFCLHEGGRRSTNPLPEVAQGWRLLTEALRKRGVEMPCGL